MSDGNGSERYYYGETVARECGCLPSLAYGSTTISFGTQRPTQPPTRPSHTIRYVSLEQSNFDMASPRRHGWTKNEGTPVTG